MARTGRQRNALLACALALLALVVTSAATPAQASERKHGLSAFGDLAYPAEFTHFNYANPDAPKGGTFSLVGWGGVTTFDSLNNFILKGDAAQGLELLFDSLMTRAADEPDAVYGLVAESAEVADDGMSVTFYLRPEARFADGSPLTADDLVFSFDALKTKGHPLIGQTLQDVVKAEALDPHTVRYSFKGDLVRDLPLTVAGLPILSKAYYSTHPFEQTSLEPPLGSGPYTVSDVKQGRTITYQPQPRLLGQGPAGQSRALQFRHHPLRIFPRPHREHGGIQGRRLRFPRGVHLQSVGDGIRFPGDPRRQGEEGGATRRDAVGHARLLPQHAARRAERSARAQGARPRLRFRMDQPQFVLRALHPHDELLRELADEGGGRAIGGGADAAQFARRAGLARGARPRLSAGQERRLGPGPRIAARSGQTARRGGVDHQERRARQRARRAAHPGDPQFRGGLRAADRALYQEPQAARHRRQDAHGGPRAISAAA